jgi:integrase/recombinase XerD
MRDPSHARGSGALQQYALGFVAELARLGLRAGEVAALRLDDIDWRAGEITVRGKGSRAERLPLPAGAGEAVAAYVRDGRPEPFEAARQVFLRVRAPHRGLTTGGAAQAVSAAGQRRDRPHLRPPATAFGGHRHAGRRAPLTEIGQVLRHRRLLPTAIYAKADIGALQALARPWPTGGAR